ncbi:MAG: 1-acylglycerol-3-phosphate O-acyltransferase [Erysipelotrichaceae bacterium]|nr:MAG: 1-acylglycerol-3-phosphate O-acyltransferase [Erysipelotrichaceae bacterium]
MKLNQWFRFIALLFPVYFSSLKQKKRTFEQRWFTLKQWCERFFKWTQIKYEGHMSPVSTNQTVYYVSNHQGQFDPILLMAVLQKPMTFISKVENLKLPVIGRWGKLIGFITFKREEFDANVTMLRQSVRTLKEGRSVLIFPEGTRSKSNELLVFKPGALLPAYLAKVPIVPITQIHTHELDKLWKHKNVLQVIIGEPIEYDQYKDIPYAQMAIKIHDVIESNIKKALN